MRSANVLLGLSSALLVGTGAAYVLVPGAMLGIVDIEATSTSVFLLRTEGVALVCAGIFVLSAIGRPDRAVLIVLVGLAAYYVFSSVIDLMAWTDGVVGDISLPSVFVRLVLGVVCALSALRLRATAT